MNIFLACSYMHVCIDISSMSVSKLKEYLTIRGVDISACVEKTDLLAEADKLKPSEKGESSKSHCIYYYTQSQTGL
jgi:hypothetical protein